jgi:galactofuranosylgalactofuranosylrhamnosyl-N-acetylglucosaminyl-diphospho-decaprenol beta-1,5/1,6-galactofuranosyltransferase
MLLRTDTWFNALFEGYWRENAHLSRLALRLRVGGTGIIRLYRRTSEREQILLQEIAFSGQDRRLIVDVPRARSASERFGLLYFELEALSSSLVMHEAEWTALDVVTQSIRLIAGFCTFNRASRLIRNINCLLADPDVAATLNRIIVVDQGAEKVRDHRAFAALARDAAGKLQLIEQDNRGGAGGFTRCLLEAQSVISATHVVLMDDDIIPEPESVLRTAAFLSLVRGDVAIGGHMLDRFHPRQLIESGSRYLPERVRIDEPSRRRVDRAGDLIPFLKPQPRHYNGWWFFALPLAVLERAGLPLPLFLRGDDVEFGCRLMRQEVSTVALPGVAVWHEPFERKGRGWHAFYELRNYLIVGALHFPTVRAATVARRFLSRVLDELLAYDYYEAWLLCEGTAAFLQGPKALRSPPLTTHRHLQTKGEKLSPRVLLHDCTLPSARSIPSVEGPFAARAWRWLLVLRNLLLPSPSSETRPQRMVNGSGEQWYDVAGVDVVGIAEPHREHLIMLRRSRGRFLLLFLRSLWLALRLLCSHRRAVGCWRAGAGTLKSRKFWMEYLLGQGKSSEPRPIGSSEQDGSLMVAARITD